jgi:aminoglycoside/choline kinase family phosphotransferase
LPPFCCGQPISARERAQRAEILFQDYDAGFLLIEDFGEGRMADLVLAGQAETPFYATATDALAHLHRTTAPRTVGSGRWGDEAACV